MAELAARDAKLIQYLNEAYGKEKELERSLQAHIRMNTRPPYKKRLQDHLKETKAQARGLQRRIKQLGGQAEELSVPGPDAVAGAAAAAQSVASQAVAAAKGPLHMLRGTSEQEKLLKNAKTEYWNEHEEIANYTAIETLAESVGDTETAKLAREYRRQEERMATFLERMIPELTKAVARAEIPAAERRPAQRAGRARASRMRSVSPQSRTTAARRRAGSGSGATGGSGA